MNKVCSDCGKEKPLDDFVKDKRYPDGHRKRCKQCENLRRRKTPVLPQPRDGHKYCVKCLKEKRLDVSNGITLCVTCHKRFHDIYSYGKNTKQQFYTFLSLVQKHSV